jgi:soluble lytic murein transglycosylase
MEISMKATRKTSGFSLRCDWLLPAAFLFVFLFMGNLHAGQDWKKRCTAYDPLIEQISAEYGLKATFIQALIWQESKFKARATGNVGEIGLMQLRMSTVRDWAKAHNRRVPTKQMVYNTELNLRIGIWRIDLALKNWEGYPEQIMLALCEYNAGRTAVLRSLAHYDGDVAKMLKYSKAGKYAREVASTFETLTRKGTPQKVALLF